MRKKLIIFFLLFRKYFKFKNFLNIEEIINLYTIFIKNENTVIFENNFLFIGVISDDDFIDCKKATINIFLL